MTATPPAPIPPRLPASHPDDPAAVVWRRRPEGSIPGGQRGALAPDPAEVSRWLHRVAVYRWVRAHAGLDGK